MTPPDYSAFAVTYATSRPTYPAALYDFVASLAPERNLAWDCATGNGQAAVSMAEHFRRVVATDVSGEQIRHAKAHPRIDYRVAPAEQSGLETSTVDAVTVASALHWFDQEAFYAEARRVLRPQGILAAWTYHVGYVEPPFDSIFERFYREVVYGYFDTGARLVDDRYASIVLPGCAIETPEFFVSVEWTFDRMISFVHSWSGTQRYIQECGDDPVPVLAKDLKIVWGDPEQVQEVRWPLYLRVARL